MENYNMQIRVTPLPDLLPCKPIVPIPFPLQITDVGSCVVSHVISNAKFKGSLIQHLSFDGVTMFCTLRQRDNRDNHRKLTVKILDFAPDPRNFGRSLRLPEKCMIS